MTKKIDVSFILPCYNVAPYVEDCINSIVNQDLNSYEIICVDDCSTDGTYSKLLEIQEKEKQVIVLRNEINSGVSYTRNVGVDEADGEYIWFVDPDDMLYPECARKLLEVAQETEADYVCGNYYEVGEKFNLQELNTLPRNTTNIKIEKGKEYIPTLFNQYGAAAPVVWCGLRKKSFLIENRLYFNPKLHNDEDFLYNIQCEVFRQKAVKLDLFVYIYRIRKTSATYGKTPKQTKRRLDSDIEIIKAYKELIRYGRYVDKINNLINEAHERCLFRCLSCQNKQEVKEILSVLKQEKLFP